MLRLKFFLHSCVLRVMSYKFIDETISNLAQWVPFRIKLLLDDIESSTLFICQSFLNKCTIFFIHLTRLFRQGGRDVHWPFFLHFLSIWLLKFNEGLPEILLILLHFRNRLLRFQDVKACFIQKGHYILRYRHSCLIKEHFKALVKDKQPIIGHLVLQLS